MAQWRAIQADPHCHARWMAFAQIFAMLDMSLVKDEKPLPDMLLACLRHNGLHHEDLGSVAEQILRRNEPFRELLDLARARDERTVIYRLASGDACRILAEPMIRSVLERVVVRDRDFEQLLSWTRRFLLELACAVDGSDHWVFSFPGLVYSLAIQCRINGYAFSATEPEDRQVRWLAGALGDVGPRRDPDDMVRVCVLGCYAPVSDWNEMAKAAGLAAVPSEPGPADPPGQQPSRKGEGPTRNR